MKHINRCPTCGTYTMKDTCAKGHPSITTRPPKYSPDDKYAAYRRTAKKQKRVEQGIL